MNQKLVKFIVILLGILIIISFITIIYGVNLKLKSNNKYNNITLLFEKSSYIEENDKILDIKNISEEYLVIKMQGKKIYYVVYDYNKDKILRIIFNGKLL